MSDERLNRVESRVERAENQIIDLNLAVSAMIEHSNQTQENFMVVVNEIQSLRANFVEMQSQFLAVQSEIRGLQTENRRILDEMERRKREDQE